MTLETPSGWYTDPGRVHELRFFDGRGWTDWVADAGTTSTDPLGPPRPKRRGVLKVLAVAGAVVVVGFVLFAALGLVVLFSEMSGGVDPMRRMDDVHAALDRAAIHCSPWDASADEYNVEAHGTCGLGRAGIVSIRTFRKASDKYAPSAPCPRIDGDAYWLDVSSIRDAALVRRIASALNATSITNCHATATT